MLGAKLRQQGKCMVYLFRSAGHGIRIIITPDTGRIHGIDHRHSPQGEQERMQHGIEREGALQSGRIIIELSALDAA